MKAPIKNKDPNPIGILAGIGVCLTLLFAFIAGIEIWHLQIATLGYFLLIVLSPALVLLVSDLKKIYKPSH